jgi:isocitrate/isopropylmalate dehydrogenase
MVYRVAVIPGDGIGTEVIPAAIRVLEAAGEEREISRSDGSTCRGAPRIISNTGA